MLDGFAYQSPPPSYCSRATVMRGERSSGRAAVSDPTSNSAIDDVTSERRGVMNPKVAVRTGRRSVLFLRELVRRVARDPLLRHEHARHIARAQSARAQRTRFLARGVLIRNDRRRAREGAC